MVDGELVHAAGNGGRACDLCAAGRLLEPGGKGVVTLGRCEVGTSSVARDRAEKPLIAGEDLNGRITHRGDLSRACEGNVDGGRVRQVA